MSNVFSDYLINGKTYDFVVETRLRGRGLCIPMAAKDLRTNGLTSSCNRLPLISTITSILCGYRITDRDAYSETVLIHSNVDNGWGIVGALATERHTIRF